MDSLIPLTSARAGQAVRISRLDGGQGLRGRLCAMGLRPGMAVEVVCGNGGPVVLDVLGSRLMIGRGMAVRIMVREV
jgi:ferrous iron transport protein A